MNMIKIYLFDGKKVILPTMAETEAGFFVETGPIRVYDTANVDKWKNHIYEMLHQAMRVIPTPRQRSSLCTEERATFLSMRQAKVKTACGLTHSAPSASFTARPLWREW